LEACNGLLSEVLLDRSSGVSMPRFAGCSTVELSGRTRVGGGAEVARF
jgi:hypothetical protein